MTYTTKDVRRDSRRAIRQYRARTWAKRYAAMLAQRAATYRAASRFLHAALPFEIGSALLMFALATHATLV